MKNIYKRVTFFILIISAVFACQPQQKHHNISDEEVSIPKGSYERNIKGIVNIETYDHYTRILNKGYGFYISPHTIVTNLSLIKGCYKVKTAITGSDEFTTVSGYLAFDIDKDLVIFKTATENLSYLKLDRSVRNIPDSIRGLYRKSRKIYAPKLAIRNRIANDSASYLTLDKKVKSGMPAFTYFHHLVGITQNIDTISRLIPSSEIESLVETQMKNPVSVYELRKKSNKVYPSYTKINDFTIETSMGDIDIKLYNETPKFRDNFIKLVSDQFYDSLLVHRVLKNFLIQTGAADSKYAGKDDIVGWQGPGYTLPTTIAKNRFHKRGAIAMSKMPAERNRKNRTDGSQFYIISGRIFTNDELADIEKEKGITFTAEQRRIYTTQGGAPYLDGDYVVFGEVTKGMDVVDKIAAVQTYAVDRPEKDIRIKTIRINYKQ